MSDTETKDGAERKEKVIHTRVPPVLDEELKNQAARLGISVSNLIRNVLNNTFNLVDDVIHDSATIATRSGKGEPNRNPETKATGRNLLAAAPQSEPGTVLGYQKLILNVNALCSQCNDILPRGSEAAFAITQPPSTGTFLCLPCLDKVKP